MQAPEREEAAPSPSGAAAAAAVSSPVVSTPTSTPFSAATTKNRPPRPSSSSSSSISSVGRFLMPNGQTLAAVLAANDPGAGRPPKTAYSSGVKGSGSAAHERRWRRESGRAARGDERGSKG